MEMQNYTIKAKVRNGNEMPKLWIEGNRLTAVGFKPAVRYTAVKTLTGLALMLDDEGKYKTSRRGETPIIELTGRVLSDAGLTVGTEVIISYVDGQIGISKA